MFTPDYNDYLEIAEDLHLRMMDIVKEAGSALAVPTQTILTETGNPPSREAAQMAEAKVEAWRGQNALCLPQFPQAQIDEIRDTISYPPVGSAMADSHT